MRASDPRISGAVVRSRRPAAAPASAAPWYDGDVTKEDTLEDTLEAPRIVFVYVGTLLMGLLVAVPLWNAILLLGDLAYVYFVGRWSAALLIAVCAGGVLLYFLSIAIFFRLGRPETMTNQTVFMIWVASITALGLGFLLISESLAHDSQMIYTQLFDHCASGSLTRSLNSHQAWLQELRNSPACASEARVNDCEGYMSAPEHEVLQHIELKYRCTGFCYAPTTFTAAPASATGASEASANASAITNASAEASEPPTAALYAASRSGRRGGHRRKLGVAQALSLAAGESSMSEASSLANANAMAGSTAQVPAEGQAPEVTFPPTLFTLANYQASCSSMTARHTRNLAGGMAAQLSASGIGLIFVSILTGFVKLLGFCMRAEGASYHYQGYVRKGGSTVG